MGERESGMMELSFTAKEVKSLIVNKESTFPFSHLKQPAFPHLQSLSNRKQIEPAKSAFKARLSFIVKNKSNRSFLCNT